MIVKKKITRKLIIINKVFNFSLSVDLYYFIKYTSAKI